MKSPLEHAATRPTLLAAAIAALVIGIRLLNAPDASAPPWDARPFDRPTNAVERVLLLHDGQTYAALAQDPTLSNPGLFYGDREEEAYRAGRPLLPWLAWAGSLGQPTAVPIALLGFSVLGTAAMVGAAASLASRLGRDPSSAWFVLAVPGATATMAYIGLTDALGTAGVLAGFFLWRSGRTRSATVAFALAILAKETGVLAVAALLIVERRRAIGLLWSVAPYAIWLVVIRLRLDVWSFAASSDGARYTAPFQGWWRAARDWGAVQWLVLSAIGVLVAVSWRRLPIELRWFSVLWIGLATCFGWQVWSKALDFPRVLLPLQVVAAICLLPSLRTGASSPEVLAPVSAGRVGLRARRSPTD